MAAPAVVESGGFFAMLRSLKPSFPSFTISHRPSVTTRQVNLAPRFSKIHPPQATRYPSNRIITSKYTVLTFLPKNLFEQFRRVANFYFLVVMIIALIPGLAPYTPVTSVLPLVFVIGVTAVKQAYEDYQRHLADAEVNARVAHVLCADGHLRDMPTEEVVVGDIIKVLDGEEFPCDLVLLNSALENEECYITTMNLDGETNLKIRSCPQQTARIRGEDLAQLEGSIECAAPNPDLYTFNGRLLLDNAELLSHPPRPTARRGHAGTRDSDSTGGSLLASVVDQMGLGSPEVEFSLGELDDMDSKARAAASPARPRAYTMGLGEIGSLDTRHLLLKGARLKNTPYVHCVAVYTGIHTKLMLNQQKAPYKFSCVERRLNYFLAIFFVVLVGMAVVSALFHDRWLSIEASFYPLMLGPPPENADRFVDLLKTAVTFLLLYNYVIPISLYVTLEMQKFMGALLVGWDVKLVAADSNEVAQARTSDLIEELGQVEHLFVDKTGTLTENNMVFRRCSVRGTRFRVEPDGRWLVDATSQPYRLDLSSSQPDIAAQREFFQCLALCHSVWVDEAAVSDTAGQIHHTLRYVSMSPDEEALVKAAASQAVNIKLITRTTHFMDLAVGGELRRHKIIHNLEFDSTRMRSSVLLAMPDGRVILYTKGADASVLPRCRQWQHEQIEGEDMAALRRQVNMDLDAYCEQGFRTLIVAWRELPQEEVTTIRQRLQAAGAALGDRTQLLSEIYDELEKDLEFLGVTAVEDRLQQGVPTAMKRLRAAGMLVWVLTGDRMETAVNVSLSAGHFHAQAIRLFACGLSDPASCLAALQDHQRFLRRDRADDARVRPGARYGAVNDSTPLKVGIIWPNNFSEKCGHVLIMDGVSVATALIHAPDLMRELCCACSAILCCRLSPIQKAHVVRLIKNQKHDGVFGFVHNDHVTLAIGDGANDVAMIREAHVGVGIMGKEGRQASRCADYAFTKFEFLTRLLLVHGQFSYHRIAYTVQYFFYKNIVFILPVLFFGPETLFSAQTLYDSWLMMVYNIFFTSWPVLTFGVLEQELSDQELMDHPQVYYAKTRNRTLSFREFLIWTLTGCYQGVVVYYGTYLLCGTIRETLGLWLYGTVVYTLALTIVTLRLALDMRYWTWFSHFVVWGSLVAYAVWLLFYCGIVDVFGPESTTGGMYWVYYQMMSSPFFWVLFAGLVMLALLPEFIIRLFLRLYWPTPVQAVQHGLWSLLPRRERECCLVGRICMLFQPPSTREERVQLITRSSSVPI
eukprot:m.224745 g.224745  ORF g.224745 m.224745 type:complete len:1261 (-) comp16540_c0_seq1:52-3834(-)